MDDGGQRENGRHKDHFKTAQSQWMMPPMHQMKDQQNMMKFMAMMSERDNAFYERNLALSEKKAAMAERDVAILQRDAAIAERDNAIAERDSAMAALEVYSRQNAANSNPGSSCPGCCSNCRGNNSSPRQLNGQQQTAPAQLSDVPYDHSREMHFSNAQPVSSVPANIDMKPQGLAKRPRKDSKGHMSKRTPSATTRKSKRGPDDLNRQVTVNKDILLGNKQQQHDWKGQDLGLNHVSFDETTMPVPGCSCTGSFRQCYRWGNGGWQSSCCTMSVSMYPLPMMTNKRHSRIGGRKMSGSAFSKLLSRLASEGHDLSVPLDLKGHWARHGTNRYITIR